MNQLSKHHRASMAANSDELLHDFFPMLRVYKNGRIERLTGEDRVPPSLDPATAVQSKDVEIAPEINVSARLYLPPNADRSKKLPLLVYYHGGGFVVESPFSPLYHKHLNHLVAAANVVAVSVNYRIAPEFPLPIAFEDSWRALEWAVAAEGSDEWITEFADPNRLYLGGDSAGGTIAHNVAMRVGSEGVFNLRGLYLNCPYFWSVEPMGSDDDEEMIKFWKKMSDRLLPVSCPTMLDADEPWINPGKDPKLSSLGCKRVLVYTGSGDFLKERGWYYKEVLSKSGWSGEVECVEVAGEEHVFSVFSPDGESGMAMIKKVASFLNYE